MSAAAGAAVLALVASPLHTVVAPGATVAVALRNVGQSAVALDIAPAGYRLDLRGRPVLGAPPRGVWLRVRRTRLSLGAGDSVAVPVRTSAPRGAGPGDHAQLVLVAASARGAGGVRLAARIGVVVVVRVPGRVVRRLVPLRLSRVGRVLRLVLVNRGNLDEWIGRADVGVRLERGGRVLATWRARPRRVLAGAKAVFEWRLPPRVTGRVRGTAILRQRVAARYHLRL